ncbi:MAG TPA: serine--tRNA ligase, partial [Acidobacteriaceae bacterium]|nr:serine--tRNA ligase [Acidobacteriaceae bacterium]
MLDLAFVRSNLELVEARLRDRGQDPAELLGDFRSLDARRRERITEAEQVKAQRNKLSEEVAKLKKSGQDAAAVMDETRALKSRMEELEAAATDSEGLMRAILARIPNLPLADVPVGASEKDNKEVKRWGEQPKLDFAAKPHWELGEQLGILDFERAAKLSGARFAVYWGDGAQLERALISFMLDIHTREHGYTEVLPPFMVNSKSLFGTGQLPKFEEDLFRCVDEQGYEAGAYRDNDHWLIPTAEVPVTNLYRDEVLDDADLTR